MASRTTSVAFFRSPGAGGKGAWGSVASLDVASLDVASLDVASLDVASLDVASLDVASLDVASLDVASLDVASLDVASLDVASLGGIGSSATFVPVIVSAVTFVSTGGTSTPVHPRNSAPLPARGREVSPSSPRLIMHDRKNEPPDGALGQERAGRAAVERREERGNMT